jgi:uncharacterized membrane protein
VAFTLGRGRPRAETARLLLTRGAWLVLLEVTVVRFGWFFDLSYQFSVFQVIWAIGWSMMLLAPLVYLPAPAVAAIGVGVIAGHNLLDGVSGGWLWTLLHGQGLLAVTPKARVFVAYAILPWFGVMAAGYGLGALVLTGAPAERRRRLFTVGGVATLLFVVLRAVNLYGDPARWAVQPRPGFSILAFLNTTKYPPSLLYLTMTLGPALLLFAALDGIEQERLPRPLRAVVSFGRVPLFYYVLHLYLLHLLAGVLAVATFGMRVFTPGFVEARQGLGFGLGVVYAAWLIALFLLYPACAWFARVKQRRRDWWLSYL